MRAPVTSAPNLGAIAAVRAQQRETGVGKVRASPTRTPARNRTHARQRSEHHAHHAWRRLWPPRRRTEQGGARREQQGPAIDILSLIHISLSLSRTSLGAELASESGPLHDIGVTIRGGLPLEVKYLVTSRMWVWTPVAPLFRMSVATTMGRAETAAAGASPPSAVLPNVTLTGIPPRK